jgi:transposase-like protein
VERLGDLTPKQRKELSQILTPSNSKDEVCNVLENHSGLLLNCPHCSGTHNCKWGVANGLQRWHCNSCGKTFNPLTGTPLAHLRHKDVWLDYSQALIDGLSLRKAAKSCKVHLTTTFRWRHRFLTLLRELKDTSFNGIVEADETFFLESYKGSRHLPRAPRKRGGKAKKRGISSEQIPVLIVRDRHGSTTDSILPSVSEEAVAEVLKPIIAKDALLCTDGASAYELFAKAEKIEHKALITSKGEHVKEHVFHIQNVNAYDSRLKTWMWRFNGIATKYLPKYLGWRRLLDMQGHSLTPALCLATVLG